MSDNTNAALVPQEQEERALYVPIFNPVGLPEEMPQPDGIGDLDFNLLNTKLSKDEVVPADLVADYFSFEDAHRDKPQMFRFAGYVTRPALDYQTKQPILDEAGRPKFALAVRLYDPEKQKVYVNQAFTILKTMWDNSFQIGQGVQITFTGLKRTKTGHNQQTFKIQKIEG